MQCLRCHNEPVAGDGVYCLRCVRIISDELVEMSLKSGRMVPVAPDAAADVIEALIDAKIEQHWLEHHEDDIWPARMAEQLDRRVMDAKRRLTELLAGAVMKAEKVPPENS